MYKTQEDYVFKQLEECQNNKLWYEINNENARYLYGYIKNLQQEKQQLISFLEDKIKETTPNIKANYYDEDSFRKKQIINSSNVIMKPVYIVYQEVLDFVNKGGKDE